MVTVTDSFGHFKKFNSNDSGPLPSCLRNLSSGIKQKFVSRNLFSLPSSKILISVLCWLGKNNLEVFLFFPLLENNLNSIEVSVPWRLKELTQETICAWHCLRTKSLKLSQYLYMFTHTEVFCNIWV